MLHALLLVAIDALVLADLMQQSLAAELHPLLFNTRLDWDHHAHKLCYKRTGRDQSSLHGLLDPNIESYHCHDLWNHGCGNQGIFESVLYKSGSYIHSG